jgi:RNA polymerase sigma-70 factor (ECF subfamily)
MERTILLEQLCACRRLNARLYWRTRNRDEADDLAQEVYLRLLKVAHPKRVRNWEAYSHTIARNVLSQELTSRARRERGRVDVADPTIQHELAEPYTTAFDTELYERRLDEVLSKVSRKCRSVVLLRRDGLTYKQVAGSVGLSTAMVKKYLKQVKVVARGLSLEQ